MKYYVVTLGFASTLVLPIPAHAQTGCDLPKDIGSKTFVPYTADNFLYVKK